MLCKFYWNIFFTYQFQHLTILYNEIPPTNMKKFSHLHLNRFFKCWQNFNYINFRFSLVTFFGIEILSKKFLMQISEIVNQNFFFLDLFHFECIANTKHMLVQKRKFHFSMWARELFSHAAFLAWFIIFYGFWVKLIEEVEQQQHKQSHAIVVHRNILRA